jgi:hypothetical protein
MIRQSNRRTSEPALKDKKLQGGVSEYETYNIIIFHAPPLSESYIFLICITLLSVPGNNVKSLIHVVQILNKFILHLQNMKYIVRKCSVNT